MDLLKASLILDVQVRIRARYKQLRICLFKSRDRFATAGFSVIQSCKIQINLLFWPRNKTRHSVVFCCSTEA